MSSISQPSVKSLKIDLKFNGQSLATGTGFVVNSASGPVLVTNRHSVTGRRQDNGKPLSTTGGIPNQVTITHNAKGRLGTWFPVDESLLDANGSPKWYEHPRLGSKADFVALPLTSLQGVELYTYDPATPGPNISVRPGDIISVIGFPFGMAVGGATAIWATGFMASEPEIDYNNLPIFLIDCRSRPGQSGSAVIANRNGGLVSMDDGSSSSFTGAVEQFLGIYSGRINEQSDIGIVWKASALAELLQAI